MGSSHSKGETNAYTGTLSPLCKLMSEHYPGSLNQIQVWAKLGFPSKGSLSESQLKQLRTQLRRREVSSAIQHAALPKWRKSKNVVFKADWEAFKMWKTESEKRESQRLKSFNALKNEPAKTDELVQPTNSQTLYPCLSECYGDPDLDSAPPAPPPYINQQPTSYTPVVTRHRAQKSLTEIRDGKRTLSAPGTPAAVTTLPMMEVAGAAGPILVFRPWSDADVTEAANYICSPKDNLSKWESDILQFVREFRPAMTEIRRLMSKTLTNDFHRIQRVFTPTRMSVRLEHPDFGHRDNADFRNAVEALVDSVREKFPLKLNLSAITNMT